jgi:hypothetical protein
VVGEHGARMVGALMKVQDPRRVALPGASPLALKFISGLQVRVNPWDESRSGGHENSSVERWARCGSR